MPRGCQLNSWDGFVTPFTQVRQGQGEFTVPNRCLDAMTTRSDAFKGLLVADFGAPGVHACRQRFSGSVALQRASRFLQAFGVVGDLQRCWGPLAV